MSFQEKFVQVLDRIEKAAQKTGRSAKDITLVAVTKGAKAERVLEAKAAGLAIFGENKVQEAQEKIPALALPDAQWHMIGHLQTNKVKTAVSLFQMIQSVDSVRLAEKISEASAEKPMPVLLEVNISHEEQKYGFKPEEIYAAIEAISAFPGIQVRGLMGMAAENASEEEKRASFKKLKGLFGVCKTLKKENVGMQFLSMGMSGDFEIAIEEGSNMVRLGRILFS